MCILQTRSLFRCNSEQPSMMIYSNILLSISVIKSKFLLFREILLSFLDLQSLIVLEAINLL